MAHYEMKINTQRHYALQQQALRLGWPRERITVINGDQGQSGETVAGRESVQQLVTAVSLGRAGIVLVLEVSRLARNASDWQRLLESCAVTGTLILDEDGLYDPRLFHDRLLLGLKGTLTEAERHVRQARLQGGIRNKAHRGELPKNRPSGGRPGPRGGGAVTAARRGPAAAAPGPTGG
jgi:DNA invertase Pin-like site-specific DNA recombinase